ncbi:50S ribosomal protein L33 [Lederbergia graminis]|uniref:Large ribosomal subunit protein bL33 n=1 Tax=Lederbergia graminis TaxID=735518 RepID=A0ABW0LJC2_9BACI
MKGKVALACGECGSRNYSTTINNEAVSKRLELKKFCKHCDKHTIHKQTK